MRTPRAALLLLCTALVVAAGGPSADAAVYTTSRPSLQVTIRTRGDRIIEYQIATLYHYSLPPRLRPFEFGYFEQPGVPPIRIRERSGTFYNRVARRKIGAGDWERQLFRGRISGGVLRGQFGFTEGEEGRRGYTGRLYHNAVRFAAHRGT